MDSLEPACTPLKQEYDACFNAWYSDKYLTGKWRDEVESYPKSADGRSLEPCGQLFKGYRECVERALQVKGLAELLDEAREDDPLSGLDPAVPTEGKSEKR